MSDYYDIDLPSFSYLKNLERSPAHYQSAIKEKKTKSGAMALGTAIHCSILEPEKFEKTIFLKLDGRTQAGKAQAENIRDFGLIALAQDEFKNCIEIRQTLFGNQNMKNLLTGEAEKEYFFEYEGVKLKSKLDLVAKEYIVDLKTCEDCRDFAFTKNFVNYHYYAQAFLYQHAEFLNSGTKKPYLILALEKEPPFEYKIYHVGESWLGFGEKKIKKWIEKYKQCCVNNDWHGYSHDVEDLSVPAWFLSKNNLDKSN